VLEVEFEGADDLVAAIKGAVGDVERRTDRELYDSVRRAERDATRRIPSGPGEGGHATSAIVSGRRGQVAFIGRNLARFKYLGWLDHGGQRPRDRRARPYRREGRYFYPAVARQARIVRKRVEDHTDAAIRARNLT
jgi:hypothetical protein